MTSKWQRLGSAFDIRDQSLALQFCGVGWLVAEPLFGISNILPTESIISAVTRLGGLIIYVFTLLAFFTSMPRYLRHAKVFCASLAVLAL